MAIVEATYLLWVIL